MEESVPQAKKPESKEGIKSPVIEVRREPALEFVSHNIEKYRDTNEEAVFMLALVLDHPEWEEEIFKQIAEHKGSVLNPSLILGKIRDDYSKYSCSEKDALEDLWIGRIPEVSLQIAKLLDYFHPVASDIPAKVVIVPSDNLLSTNQGRSFSVGPTHIIMSHSENADNMSHEFLHSIINPLTERLKKHVPNKRIIALASGSLKENYGEHAQSLLNEELIRTYVNLVQHGEKPRSFETFEEIIMRLTDEHFAGICRDEPDFKTKLTEMGIKTLAEFQSRKREYFERYIRNELRERIYRFYMEYDSAKAIYPNISFEEFLAENIKRTLA